MGVKESYEKARDGAREKLVMPTSLVDAYFNWWQEQLEKRGLAKPFTGQVKPRPWYIRALRLFLISLIAQWLFGGAAGLIVFVVLGCLIIIAHELLPGG